MKNYLVEIAKTVRDTVVGATATVGVILIELKALEMGINGNLLVTSLVILAAAIGVPIGAYLQRRGKE